MAEMDRDTRSFVRKAAKRTWKRKGSSPYTSGATVVSEGRRPKVLVDGAEEPVEAEAYLGAKRGDRVSVEVSHSGVRIKGNLTSPPTDDEYAERAYRMADSVKGTVDEAYERAAEAHSAAAEAHSAASEANRLATDAAQTVSEMDDQVQRALEKATQAAEFVGTVESRVVDAEAAAGQALADAEDALNHATAVENEIHSVNLRIDVGDEQTLVRAQGSGVLVGKVGQTPCALVNSSGHFDVVDVTWEVESYTDPEGEERTRTVPVRVDPIASFGSITTIGTTSGCIEISDSAIHLKRGGANIATIEGDSMDITRVQVTDSLVVNNWRWKQNANGNISFKWREGE